MAPDIGFKIDALGGRHRLADASLGVVDQGRGFGHRDLGGQTDLRGDENLLGTKVHGAQVNHVVNSRVNEGSIDLGEILDCRGFAHEE